MALKNVRIIEFAGLAPGPFAGLILADWGADVIRIDRPGAPAVDTLCRHKRSVVLDVKDPDALNIIRQLIVTADVVIDPFRPGVMERIGLGPDVFLSENGLNRRLVFARLAGFPPTGPQKDAAGHDINYMALSGVLSMLPGESSKPSAPLNLVADFGGGSLTCALGVLLALLERQSSGLGQVVSTDMVSGARYISTYPLQMATLPAPDSIFPVSNFPLSPPASSKMPTTRMRNTLDGGAPFYNVYTCADGRWISVGCLEPRFYKVFVERLLGALPEEFLKENQSPKLTEQYKTETWPPLKIFLEKAFKMFDRDHWTGIFENSDACAFPVLSPWEASALASRYERPEASSPVPAPHPNLSRTPARSPSVGQEEGILQPGQHTAEVLRELGLGSDRIEHLTRHRPAQQGKSKPKL